MSTQGDMRRDLSQHLSLNATVKAHDGRLLNVQMNTRTGLAAVSSPADGGRILADFPAVDHRAACIAVREGEVKVPTRAEYDANDGTVHLEADAVAIIDLGGPDGGRFWRVTTGQAVDHPDAHSAAVHARVTGSVGASYNDATVEAVR